MGEIKICGECISYFKPCDLVGQGRCMYFDYGRHFQNLCINYTIVNYNDDGCNKFTFNEDDTQQYHCEGLNDWGIACYKGEYYEHIGITKID